MRRRAMGVRLRTGLAVSLLLVSTLALGGVDSARGASESFGRFRLGARSDVTAVEYFDSRTPVAGTTQALLAMSPASAQARVDSLGESKAFASAPYPGPVAVSMPRLLAGVGVEGIPDYPFYVSSEHPTDPQRKQQQGPYSLAASSTATTSTGEARIDGSGSDGQQSNGISARAVGKAEDERLLARAEGTFESLAFGDVLRIGSLESLAEVVVTPDGPETVRTSFEATGVSVNGTAVRLTPEGLEVADETVPVDSTPIEEQLERAGFEVEFLAPRTGSNEEGAVIARSGGLEVRTERTGPDGETSIFVFTLGRSTVTVESTVDAASSDGGLSFVGVSDTPASGAGDTDRGTTVVEGSVRRGGRTAPEEATAPDPVGTAEPTMTEEGGAATAPRVSAGPSGPLALGAAEGEMDLEVVYALLGLAGLGGVAASGLRRFRVFERIARRL